MVRRNRVAEMTRKRAKQKRTRKEDGLPFVAVVLGTVGFLFAYLFAEAGLDPQAHPIHWMVAGAGAVLGMGLGYLWYRLRGDIG
jgi:protein-S-isoprenylcysteine O-methyltransferase Ste14